MRVLVVEDEAVCQKLAALVLENQGHDVVSVATADQARAEIENVMPDAVLLDLQLPGVTGLDFVRRLRADDATRALPILATTGYPLRWTEGEARAAGCEGYVVKPIDTRMLGALLEAICDAAARAASTRKVRA